MAAPTMSVAPTNTIRSDELRVEGRLTNPRGTLHPQLPGGTLSPQ